MNTPSLSALRLALIFGVIVNLCLIVVRVLSYQPLLAMPGALSLIAEPAIALVGCALFAVLATSGKSTKRNVALCWATGLGIVGGALLVVHMILEQFGNHIGENGRITLAFMFITFFIWGVAGYMASRSTTSAGIGLLGGCWSAVVSVLIAVGFGFMLMFFEIPQLDYVATWSEFKQSGWTDVHAFAIANSLEAGFTHLLVGFVVGSIFGGIGAVTAMAMRAVKPVTMTSRQ